MIAQELQKQGYRASEVVAVVFGKKNQTDLQAKFKTKVGPEWASSVRTIHSLCYEIYRSALGVEHRQVNLERSKYKEIAQKLGLLPVESESRSNPGSLLEDGLIFAEKDFLELLEKLRLYCLDATIDNVEFLTDLYKLGIKGIPQVATAAVSCLSQGLKEATSSQYRIDTTDMVWVPWVLRENSRFAGAIKKRREQLRVLMLDEAQDTDLLQIEILSLLIDPERSFLVGVGDRQQAVYFFRGCLSDGLELIATRFHGENLPLPICYRCGVEHLELVRSIFPHIPIQPRPNAPRGQIQAIWEKDFLSIFNNAALSYMGVCRKNAPLTIAAIQLLAAGKPAKIKDRNIGSRLVSRVREICQRKRYTRDSFPQFLREYEVTQKRRLAKFPDGEAKVSELEDVLQAIAALFQAYEPKTLKAWEEIVSRIFDESGYSPISLYSIHSGKGGEGQVTFILSPDELPLEHPKQVEEERAQEQNLLYVALTRTLADEVDGAGMLFLVIREDQDGKPKYPAWLPDKYRTLKVKTSSPDPGSFRNDNDSLWSSEDSEVGWTELADEILDELGSHAVAEDFSANNCSQPINQSETMVANNCSGATKEETWGTATETFDSGVEQRSRQLSETETQPLESTAATTNNGSSSNLSLEELEEKIRRGFNLTRDFYECGKSLVLVRDRALYEPNFANFEEYCEKRFGKSLRLAQYFMSAAVVVDNLLEAECAILPTAESQVRAIASLPTHQQVEIWQKACDESKGVPIASKVREVKAAVLGEPKPERTFKSEPWVKLPNPSTLLNHLKDRLKETKVSLKDVEVLLELIQELNYGDR